MRSKASLWALPLALLAGAVWLYRDVAPVRQVLEFVHHTVRQTAATVPTPALPSLGTAADGPAAAPRAPAGARPPGGLRKCVGGGTVVYTDGSCPAGTQAQAVTGGTVTVMPAQPVPASADAPASRASTIRDLVMKPGEKTIQEMAVERATGEAK
ncbi:hypothetical protein [Ideonella sp. A 288]|uniref:hypothetical protein n=1 Tax=Ideonella sp. A 288 TaxID=1962181 RepID=UPI000B4B62A6|nr:hypothetical protein [Ideonella sp. A 288]